MPMTKHLDVVRVRGDWAPLMSRLSGWQHTAGGWTEGSAVLKDRSDTFDVSLRAGDSSTQTNHPYPLNHFALEVNALGGAEEKFWANKLNCTEVLRATQQWDPLTDAPMNAVHFYKPGEPYVTLRESGVAETRLHHIGFEAANKQLVLDAGEILKEIGWENFWEGDLDGSYVLHFRAPDGLIHDIFCPEDKLKAEAKEILNNQ